MQRLHRRADIHRALREGRRQHCAWGVLHSRRRAADGTAGDQPRLAVIAGRRFRTAVARNRARRILRETCRTALGARGGEWDLVLVARPEVLESEHGQRLDSLTGALQDAGVLPKKAASVQ